MARRAETTEPWWLRALRRLRSKWCELPAMGRSTGNARINSAPAASRDDCLTCGTRSPTERFRDPVMCRSVLLRLTSRICGRLICHGHA